MPRLRHIITPRDSQAQRKREALECRARLRAHMAKNIYQEVDGYYVVHFKGRHGFWEPHMLRELANLLDEMNKPWHAKVCRDLGRLARRDARAKKGQQ